MKVIYINTVFEDYVSSESTYILLCFCVVNDDETQSLLKSWNKLKLFKSSFTKSKASWLSNK